MSDRADDFAEYTSDPLSPLELRFWSKVSFGDHGPAGDCWEWTAATKRSWSRPDNSGGPTLPYGCFRFEGRKEYAHRVSFHLETGADLKIVPLVGHECDNPRCQRPSHLRFSSHSQNLQEAWDRGRRARELEHLEDLGAFFEQAAQ